MCAWRPYLAIGALLWAGPASAQDAVSDEAAATQDAEPALQEDAPREEPVADHVLEARERVARGERLFERGDFDAAMVEFERAYEVIGEHPHRYLILYNIGQCHERRFRYHEALRFYQRYLDEGGEEDPDRGTVEGAIRTLDDLLGTVRVNADVSQASVHLDDREIAPVPAEVRVAGGRHVIEVRAEGYVPSRRSVSVPAGGVEQIDAHLVPVGEANQGLHPAIFGVGVGLTLATLGVGLGFGVAALQAEAEVARNDDPVTAAVMGLDAAYFAHPAELALAADILFGIGGALAISTAVLAFLTEWDPEAGPDSARLRPFVSPRSSGVSVGIVGAL